MNDRDLSALSPERRELLELLLKDQSAERAEPSLPTPVESAGGPDQRSRSPRTQLSLAQERMWVSERLVGAAPGSVHALRCDLEGPLNVDALGKALAEIVSRHAVLRTSFIDDSGPTARVETDLEFSLDCKDIPCSDPGQREDEIRRVIAGPLTQEPFDLTRGPMFRALLLRSTTHHHTLLFVVHHIVFDGWSGAVFGNELQQLYAAFCENNRPSLDPLPIQFSDFAHWQRTWVSSDACRAQLDFWKERLAGNLPLTQLESDRPRVAANTRNEYSAKHIRFEFPAALCRQIEQLNQEHGTTVFMALLAGLQILLYRCTGQEDVIIGSPAANRSKKETEALLGCFMHPLVLRTDLSGNPTFRELLQRVRKVCLDAYKHQDAPFELVARELRPDWNAESSPLFQVLFNVQPKRTASIQLPGVEVTRFELKIPTTALDLSLHLWTGEQYEAMLEYRAALFDEATMSWFADRFLATVEAAIQHPNTSIDELPVRGPTKLNHPAEPDTEDLSAARRELLELLLQEQSTVTSGSNRLADNEAANVSAIPACGRDGDVMPASFGQERLWFFEQIETQKGLLNQSQQLLLDGPLNVDALERALNALFQRHEILRTGFVTVDGRPYQRILDSADVELVKADLSHLDPAAKEHSLNELSAKQACYAFDLGKPPLVRYCLARLDVDKHCLLATVHHLIGDGWSLRVFRKELAALYQGYCQDPIRGLQLANLESLPIQYADFAQWQRQECRELVFQGQLAYWRQQLGGELPVLQLPTRSETEASTNERSRDLSINLGQRLSNKLLECARDEGATPFMVLLTAFKSLLHRYSGQNDLIVDTPVAGRARRELEGLIGFFVNSLALRTDVQGRPSFRDLLSRVRQTCLEAFSNQDLPFDRVVAALDTSGSRRGQPVARTSFMLHHDITEELQLGEGVRMTPQEPDVNDEFDLTLIVWQNVDGFRCQFHFKGSVFEPETIERMTGHWLGLVAGMLATPERPIDEIEMLSEEELEFLLETSNQTKTSTNNAISVHSLFEQQAERTPNAPAVLFRPSSDSKEPSTPQTVTYAELNRHANSLARRLVAAGVELESRVGVLLDRTPQAFAVILAVLKAGATYVPIDPTYPRERAEWMVQDAQITLLVTQEDHADTFRDRHDVSGISLLVLDSEVRPNSVTEPSNENLPPIPSADSPAYMIYTSGSTGTPKGVLTPHRAVVNHNLCVRDAFKLSSADRVLQFHSLSFDAAVEETFPTWAAGGAVVMSGDKMLSPRDLESLIENEQLTVLNLPTSYWHEWVSEASASSPQPRRSLRLIIVGGDKASPSQLATWKQLTGDRVRWLNTYGPTETAVISTLDEPSDAEVASGRLTIGRPINNTQIYILDPQMRPTPIGVAGEMYIGGEGVARGYHNRPELTAERFVPNPFGCHPYDRLYRTGDRTRRLEDGRIEFLGRVDHQVKIRGFRIEPGEVEARLCQQPGVQQAVVIPHKENGNEEQLAAYITPESNATSSDATWKSTFVENLRCTLRNELPEYMNPSWIVLLDRLPLTRNGKVDRRALPKPQGGAQQEQRKFSPPSTDTQKRVAEIWRSLLGLERVGVNDNFFDLGGHSLLLFQLQHRLAAEFSTEIPAVELFRLATVDDQASRLEGERSQNSFQDVRDRAAKQRSQLSKKRRLAKNRNRQSKTRDND